MLYFLNIIALAGTLNLDIIEKHDRCYYLKINEGYMDAKSTALDYISSFIGVPYKWGGDDYSAMDCSGLVVEYLKCLGVIGELDDYNAQGIWDLLIRKRVIIPQKGDLVFFYKEHNPVLKITHVEILLNEEFSIGAMGGGPLTINEDKAIKQNAFIKVRRFKHKKNIMGYINPLASDNAGKFVPYENIDKKQNQI